MTGVPMLLHDGRRIAEFAVVAEDSRPEHGIGTALDIPLPQPATTQA